MKLTKKIFEFYKLPLLVSLTLFIILMAMINPREPLQIIMILLGCLLGTFFLDLDYIIYAYFTDKDKAFSQTLRRYLKHKDFGNALAHVYFHQTDVKEKTLHSVLFQVVSGALALFMIFAPINLFAKSIVISIYLNSLYRLAYQYYTGETKDWFWALKEKPSKEGVKIFLIINVVLFLIAIQFL